MYHELPIVDSVLKQYPNISHFVFRTDPVGDALKELSVFDSLSDFPVRNSANYHWILGAYRHALDAGARVMLTGDAGNATISWWGTTLRMRASWTYECLKSRMRPERVLHGRQRRMLHPGFTHTPLIRKALRRDWVTMDWYYWQLGQESRTAFNSTLRHPALWHGVEYLDPTNDVRVAEFCYNLPQWVFRRGNHTVETRLLVREALADEVPEAVRLNNFRGEQAADGYLHYNAHRDSWKRKLLDLSPEAADILWRGYDREAVLRLLDQYLHVESHELASYMDLCLILMPLLSSAFFLDHADRYRP
jgi:hypothetical protein